MASIQNGNTFYIDAASASGTAASFLKNNDVKVLAIYFTGAVAGDSVVLNDLNLMNAAGTPAAGALKWKVTTDVAYKSNFIDLHEAPIRFPNGIWVSTISALGVCTLVLDKAS